MEFPVDISMSKNLLLSELPLKLYHEIVLFIPNSRSITF